MEETLMREEIGGSILYQYLNSITSVLAGFIFYIYVIHFYGSELVGTVALLLAIVSLLNIFFSLGTGNGLQHYISFFLGKGDYNKIRAIIVNFSIITIILASIGLIVIYVLSPELATLFFHTFKYIVLIKMLGLDLFFTLTSGLFGSMLIGLQKFKSQAKWNIVGTGISYSLPVLFLIFTKNINLIVIGWAAGNILSTLAYISLLVSSLKIITDKNKGRFPVTPVIKYSTPIFLASLIGYGASYVDRFIVSFLLNLSLLGIYNFALLISTAIAFISGPFGNILLPKLSEMYGKDEKENMKYNISKGIEILATIYVPIALLVASLSSYILLFLSNREYLQAAVPVIIVLFISSIFISGNILAIALQSIRKTRIFIITSSVALLSNFVLSFILIPKFQMIGAAIGYSSVNISSFIVLYYFAKKFDILKFEGIKLLKIYAASIIMFVIIFLFDHVFLYSISKLFMFIILGFIIYIILIKGMKTFSNEDIDFLMLLIPKRLKEYRWIVNLMFLRYDAPNQ